MSFAFEKITRNSPHCKLFPVQYQGYEYGPLINKKDINIIINACLFTEKKKCFLKNMF